MPFRSGDTSKRRRIRKRCRATYSAQGPQLPVARIPKSRPTADRRRVNALLAPGRRLAIAGPPPRAWPTPCQRWAAALRLSDALPTLGRCLAGADQRLANARPTPWQRWTDAGYNAHQRSPVNVPPKALPAMRWVARRLPLDVRARPRAQPATCSHPRVSPREQRFR